MPMLKTLGTAVDMTATGATDAVELGHTPFFPGGNAILRLSAPIGGAGVIQVQGADKAASRYLEATMDVKPRIDPAVAERRLDC